MSPVPRLYSLVIFALCASAHFILQYPKSLGFDDDIESTAPCGGFDVSFNASDDSVQVGGFAVSMLSTHPAANWLFRVTLDKQAPFNWTNLLPVVSETGLGQFCLPALQAPSDFAGQPGVVQVIQQGPDGILYQVSRCRMCHYVEGLRLRFCCSSNNFNHSALQLTSLREPTPQSVRHVQMSLA